MATVNHNQTFQVDTANKTDNDSSSLQFETKAYAGMHVPNSFKNRVWANVLSFKLSYLLYGFIFGQALMDKKSPMYPNLKLKSEKTLQFLLKSSSEMGTRSMFTKLLADLTIVFQTLSDIHSYKTDIVDKCLIIDGEKELINLVRHYVKRSQQQTIEGYASAFLFFNNRLNLDRSSTYHSWEDKPEHQFQCLQC